MTFDGATFEPGRDRDRLARQLTDVRRLMADGRWRTLAEIEAAVGAPQASVSARLRDLRKPKFGAFTVARRYVGDGLWAYQLTPPEPAQEGKGDPLMEALPW